MFFYIFPVICYATWRYHRITHQLKANLTTKVIRYVTFLQINVLIKIVFTQIKLKASIVHFLNNKKKRSSNSRVSVRNINFNIKSTIYLPFVYCQSVQTDHLLVSVYSAAKYRSYIWYLHIS